MDNLEDEEEKKKRKKFRPNPRQKRWYQNWLFEMMGTRNIEPETQEVSLLENLIETEQLETIEFVQSPGTARVITLRSSISAFVALRDDGTVATYCRSGVGGDVSCVIEQLTDIVELHSCVDAFAAVKRNGRIVTWGGKARSLLKKKLKVTTILETMRIFLADGMLLLPHSMRRFQKLLKS